MHQPQYSPCVHFTAWLFRNFGMVCRDRHPSKPKDSAIKNWESGRSWLVIKLEPKGNMWNVKCCQKLPSGSTSGLKVSGDIQDAVPSLLPFSSEIDDNMMIRGEEKGEECSEHIRSVTLPGLQRLPRVKNSSWTLSLYRMLRCRN